MEKRAPSYFSLPTLLLAALLAGPALTGCGGGSAGGSAPSAEITVPGAVTTGLPWTASVPQVPGASYAWSLQGGTLAAGGGTHAVTFIPGDVSSLALAVEVSAAGTTVRGTAGAAVHPAPWIYRFQRSGAALQYGFAYGSGSLEPGGVVLPSEFAGSQGSWTVPALVQSTDFILRVTNPAGTVAAAGVRCLPGNGSPVGSPVAMLAPREGHSATRLGDGRVLIAGGSAIDLSAGLTPQRWVQTCEVYDPAASSFSAVGSLGTPRQACSATLLEDGRVLLAGGASATATLASCEVFDPPTGTFAPTGAMGSPRRDHQAVLLRDGRVLVLGGSDGQDDLASAELFDPATGTFAPAGSLAVPRWRPSAVRLADDRVLVAGGRTVLGSAPEVQLDTSELYDPAAGTFTAGAGLLQAQVGSTATRLADGRVLLAGALWMEIYDPAAGAFTVVTPLSSPSAGAAVLLSSGKVLLACALAGGGSALLTVDPGNGIPVDLCDGLPSNATLTLLADGKALVTGGHWGMNSWRTVDSAYIVDLP